MRALICDDDATVGMRTPLGVSDDILKPLRHSSFVAKIDNLLRSFPKEQTDSDASALQIGPGRPTTLET